MPRRHSKKPTKASAQERQRLEQKKAQTRIEFQKHPELYELIYNDALDVDTYISMSAVSKDFKDRMAKVAVMRNVIMRTRKDRYMLVDHYYGLLCGSSFFTGILAKLAQAGNLGAQVRLVGAHKISGTIPEYTTDGDIRSWSLGPAAPYLNWLADGSPSLVHTLSPRNFDTSPDSGRPQNTVLVWLYQNLQGIWQRLSLHPHVYPLAAYLYVWYTTQHHPSHVYRNMYADACVIIALSSYGLDVQNVIESFGGPAILYHVVIISSLLAPVQTCMPDWLIDPNIVDPSEYIHITFRPSFWENLDEGTALIHEAHTTCMAGATLLDLASRRTEPQLSQLVDLLDTYTTAVEHLSKYYNYTKEEATMPAGTRAAFLPAGQLNSIIKHHTILETYADLLTDNDLG